MIDYNAKAKHYCFLEPLKRRAIISPALFYFMERQSGQKYRRLIGQDREYINRSKSGRGHTFLMIEKYRQWIRPRSLVHKSIQKSGRGHTFLMIEKYRRWIGQDR